jgi:hypothetical protein
VIGDWVRGRLGEEETRRWGENRTARGGDGETGATTRLGDWERGRNTKKIFIRKIFINFT